MKDLWVPGAGLSRRTLLKSGAGLAALSATGVAGPVLAQGAPFDWKRFKGEKIEVSLVKSPRADLLQKYQKEFEELTGITVGAEQIPEQQHRQKQVIEFTSGRPSFDVTSVAWHVQKRLFGKGQWLADLRGYLNDPSMTAADYDFADIAKGALEYGTQADGRLDALPLFLDYFCLYYNKELFQAKGVAFPKNYDAMLEAAVKLTDPKSNVYGFVSRGLKNANVVVWTALMLGWGADTLKPNGELNTDGPEAIAAAELYKKLNKDCAPPGTVGFNWNECQSAFAQGRVAMWLDGTGWAPPLEDPAKSKIVGKVGYGVVPAGPKAQAAALYGDGIGVASASRKKGPAYFYVQWATGKLNQNRVLETGSGAPGRLSSYTDPKVLANVKAPKEWVECVIGSSKIARPGLPNIIPVTEFRDVFGVALTNMLGGADAATELKKATEQFKPILEKSEKA